MVYSHTFIATERLAAKICDSARIVGAVALAAYIGALVAQIKNRE